MRVLMQVIYADDPPPTSDRPKSIFLAGPTPRSAEVQSWRPEAIECLNSLGWDGLVLVPERSDWKALSNYENQVEWERICLLQSNRIVFWVPRNLETMPAFTTNVEFGYWVAKNPSKVWYGRPDDSPKNRYLDWMYREFCGRQPFNSLSQLLAKTVEAMQCTI